MSATIYEAGWNKRSQTIGTRRTRGFPVLFVVLLCALPLHASDDCLSCHAIGSGLKNSRGKSVTVKAEILGKSVHKDLQCTDCHAGAAKFPHTAKTASASCLACHPDVPQQLGASAHAALGKPDDSQTCMSCHGNHNVAKPAMRGAELCATCHAVEVKQFAESIHGRARGRGNGDAPGCKDCHGPAHQTLVRSDPNSAVSKAKLPETCGHCHSDPALASKYMFAVAKPVEAYQSSVHGRAILSGNLNAAACNDCHGVHNILPAADVRSPISKFKVASTCAQCHPQVFDQYRESIHGRAVASGIASAPTCIDCHGEHDILAPNDPKSPVFVTNLSTMTCSRCHEDRPLTERFAIPAGRLSSYEKSYHGLAARTGSQTVANCASCHGVHNILPSSDPRSTIAKGNLGATCGKCHPDAGQKFALGPVHILPSSPAENRWLYFVRVFYLFTIPATLGFMLFHNLLDWLRKLRRHIAQYRSLHTPLRLTLSERVQHGLLLTSFITLVITGFMLKFPGSFWAVPLVRWERDLPLRGLLHRIAGVVLIGVGFYHAAYLLFTRDGRRSLHAMLPKVRDAREAIQTVGYNLGYRRQPPQFAKFNYAEKVEYWALVWGTIVMAITGFLLWAHNYILKYFSNLLIDVATAIHFYEAILATLAIVIWHFYAVIFDPDVYPLKWTFINGRAPEHENREEVEELDLPQSSTEEAEREAPDAGITAKAQPKIETVDAVISSDDVRPIH
jgi:formate dehydrogenase gamma subunit